MELDPEYRPMFESLVIQGRLLGCSCEPEYLSLAEVAERNATPEQPSACASKRWKRPAHPVATSGTPIPA